MLEKVIVENSLSRLLMLFIILVMFKMHKRERLQWKNSILYHRSHYSTSWVKESTWLFILILAYQNVQRWSEKVWTLQNRLLQKTKYKEDAELYSRHKHHTSKLFTHAWKLHQIIISHPYHEWFKSFISIKKY